VADQEQIKLTGRGFVEENIMQIVVPDSGDLSSIAAINDFVARIKAWAGEREIVLVVNRTGMEQQALDANLTAAYPSTVIVTDITDENWKDIRTSL
jgi:hypothetical protein